MLSDNARTMGPLRQKLQYVDVWLRRRHLSDRLARRVRAYYTEIWVDHEGLPSLLLLQHALVLGKVTFLLLNSCVLPSENVYRRFVFPSLIKCILFFPTFSCFWSKFIVNLQFLLCVVTTMCC